MLLLLLFFWLRMIAVGSAQTTCSPHPPPSSGRVVLTYTPYVTPQVPPTSTVYRHIVTAWTYAVDCRYVTISQVDDNRPVEGAFEGTPVTVDALTITRIGCVQETSAITRRDVVRGFPVETPIVIKSEGQRLKPERIVQKRTTLMQTVVDIASKQADEIPPDAQGISVRAYGYMVQVNTALYAVNLYNTGFNMSATCTLLNDPITEARLVLASIDPGQAQALVCYAAKYGFFFDMSNTQLLSDLLGIIYSIEVKSGFTNNSTTICDSLRLGAASFLGIDAQGIRSYICGDQFATTISANHTATTQTILITGTGAVGTGGTGGFGVSPTGIIPPFANSTSSGATVHTGSATAPSGTGFYTNFTTGIITSSPNNTRTYLTYSATGYASSGYGVVSDSFNITFPNATAASNGSKPDGSNLPPSPTAAPYYAVWTTSTTSDARLPRY